MALGFVHEGRKDLVKGFWRRLMVLFSVKDGLLYYL